MCRRMRLGRRKRSLESNLGDIHDAAVFLWHFFKLVSKSEIIFAKMNNKNNERVFKMSFASVYPHYLTKLEKKGRSVEELHEVIFWLTGYTEEDLKRMLGDKTNFQDFFESAPKLNTDRDKIKGVICGYRVEDIQDPLMQNIRYLDKLVDELAKGKSMEKVLRK